MSRKRRLDATSQDRLALLLDALATEILEGRDHEVAVNLWDLDAAGRNALEAVRHLVTSLSDSPDTPEVSKVVAPGQGVHLTRNC